MVLVLKFYRLFAQTEVGIAVQNSKAQQKDKSQKYKQNISVYKLT